MGEDKVIIEDDIKRSLNHVKQKGKEERTLGENESGLIFFMIARPTYGLSRIYPAIATTCCLVREVLFCCPCCWSQAGWIGGALMIVMMTASMKPP